MQNNANAFSGVAFHCYGGPASNQDIFRNAYPNKVFQSKTVYHKGLH